MEKESMAERLHECPPDAAIAISALIKIVDNIGNDFSGYGARLYVQQQVNILIDEGQL